MRQHGTRAKYVADKCRCQPCTAANAAYQRGRERHQARVRYGIEQPRRPFIDATETRQHLLWLSSVGVGRRQIHARSGIGISAIDKIRTGKVTKIRPATADKLLAVGKSMTANRALVDARDTWKKINELLGNGWTKAAIDRALGGRGRTLQIGRIRVTAGTARRIDQLHHQALLPTLRRRQMDKERQRAHRERTAA